MGNVKHVFGHTVFQAISAPHHPRLMVVGSGYWSADTRAGLHPGFNGSIGGPPDNTFKADSTRTLLAMVKWLTGKSSGASILILTRGTGAQDTPVGDAYGNQFQDCLTTAGHSITVTGSGTDFGAYEPLNFDLTCWDSSYGGGTYHGLSSIADIMDYLLSKSKSILGGTSGQNWSRYGIDCPGAHAVSGGAPTEHLYGGGPGTDWLYQRPFVSSALGALASGGSWSTTDYALVMDTTDRLALGTNTMGGSVTIEDCALAAHATHGDPEQGVIGLWWI